MEDLWVFGYGSLMWRPGFDYLESQKATLHGLHRRLCIYSWEHRGTRENPGLVLGLDAGGSCRGVVFRAAPSKRDEVIAYLREREMMNNVYYEAMRSVVTEDGQKLKALTYCAVKGQQQYAPRLSLDETLNQIRGSVGQSGRNEDYVISTVQKIEGMGAQDQKLAEIARHLKTD